MKLTPKEAAEARERRLAYEANMAVEGIFIDPQSRALFDRMDAECVGYEEGVQMVLDDLCRRGMISASRAKRLVKRRG
jgi:hypothetical protein